MSQNAVELAYLCSQYPAVSHTFINREIEQLQANGIKVHPFTMRRGSILEGATDFEKSQFKDTWVIHDRNKISILFDLIIAFLKQPVGFVFGLFFAIALQKGRIKESLWAIFHFIEAAVMALEMKRRNVSHVHVHFANSETAIAMYAHKAFGITYSFTLHGPDCLYNLDLGHFATKVAHARFIVTISHFATGQVVRVAGVEFMEKMGIVRCGVDPERYTPEVRVGRVRDKFTIVCTGRLTPTKGQALLLRAAATLAQEGRDFVCYLIGSGDEFDAHQAKITELGIGDKVKLTGALPQDGVREHLAQADLFVLPSFAEGVPVVLMEAMSMEIPCISTRVGGIAELIDHEVNGWLNHSGDLGGLTDTLREAMDNSERLPEMGRKARAKIQECFDVRKSGARLADIFKKHL